MHLQAKLLINENYIRGVRGDNMEAVRREDIYYWYDLKAIPVFITRENINTLFLESSFDRDLGILNIDIDGNDYWVWKEINVMKPRIIICEYNPILGKKEEVTTIYKDYREDFNRTREHYSNLLFGASL